MKNKVPVVILAGGYGTRLSEYTQKIPKPLVPVNNKPLIHHIISHYSQYGFNDFIICLGYKGNMIKKYFSKIKLKNTESSNSQFKEVIKIKIKKRICSIGLIDTGLTSLTALRLKKIKRLINTDYFLLTYGDGLSKVNINKLINFHKLSKKVITFTAVRPPARFGEVKFKKNTNQIQSFEEKNKIDAGWINGGFFVVNKEFFKFIPYRNVMLEKYPLIKALKENKLGAFKYSGFWHCVDSKRDLDKLDQVFKKKKISFA